jgi:hypothetical protein
MLSIIRGLFKNKPIKDTIPQKDDKVEPVWFPIIPHNSFEKLSDTSYKFIVDIPISTHSSKYFAAKFDNIIINKDNTCHLRSLISEEQYKNWKYIIGDDQEYNCYNIPYETKVIFYNIHPCYFTISKNEETETHYLDLTIVAQNYLIILTETNNLITQIYSSILESERRKEIYYRSIEISEKWESINDCFLELIDISEHVESSKENNSYIFYLDGLDVIDQRIDVRIPYGKSYGRTETVKFDSAKFHLTDKMFQSMVFLKEAQDRILDIIPDCIVQIEVNSKYLKVDLI